MRRYVAALGSVYSVDLNDGYMLDGLKPMFQGIDGMGVGANIVIAPLALLAVLATWHAHKRYKSKQKGLSAPANDTDRALFAESGADVPPHVRSTFHYFDRNKVRLLAHARDMIPIPTPGLLIPIPTSPPRFLLPTDAITIL